ncbi:creatininase family protein [Oscillatoria sp. FACHB-1406]|uniref:creatininase family protein n=1 Tax=Oscillatoria sp. FACHB-1406 TaxID=2692846 RepID=UPI00321FB778
MHGFIPPERYYPYLTQTDIEAIPDRANTVILQPIGAIEQHGPHLPLAVDAAIASGILGAALEVLDSDIPAYALPTLYYGKSNEHWHFPGTISLSATTLLAILMDLADSLYRAGFRKLAFVNAHGGQPEVLAIAARDIHLKYGDFCVFPLFLWNVPQVAEVAEALFDRKEIEWGIHAGGIETSLMLSLLPDWVKMERAVFEFPQNLPQNSLLSMEGRLPFAWATQDLSKSGVLGDATIATREKGDRLKAALVAGWVQAIGDLHQFEQPHPLGTMQ